MQSSDIKCNFSAGYEIEKILMKAIKWLATRFPEPNNLMKAALLFNDMPFVKEKHLIKIQEKNIFSIILRPNELQSSTA